MDNNSHLQDKVDSMLHRGILFSILWLMGIGSAISIFQAIKAMKIIKQSNGTITGMGKVWWCFIAGGWGVMFWGFVMLKVIINSATDQ
jgi:hypothetical protein